MSDADRRKWERRYAAGSYAGREHPTALLVDWAGRAPPGAALDVACGAGRNSLYLAEAGRRVDAVDVSAAGLERGRDAAVRRGVAVDWREADLDAGDAALPRGPYALIVVVRYVNRRLLPTLLERLAPGGLVVIEQHVDSSEAVVGPRSDAFRMRHNELLRQYVDAADRGMRLRLYREDVVTDPDGRRAALAQLVVERQSAAGAPGKAR